MNIAIIGGGSWGLALANLLHDNDNKVKVWEYNKDYVEMIKTSGRNDIFLPDIDIQVEVTSRLDQVILPETEMLILATPSSFLKQVIQETKPFIAKLKNLKYIINVAKGFDHSNGDILSQMIKKELPEKFTKLICVLSGPSHAEEVARKKPTTVTIAGENLDYLKSAQLAFSNDYFRVYSTTDIIGVELGGALKNVIALAAGIVVGLGLGDNTLGALLTRGNVEIKRLAVAMGAKPETLDGLAGMGDLITTAISPHSRNRFVGVELGKGRKLKDILANMKMVAEGVLATNTTYLLAERYQINMPIVEATYKILHNEISAKDAIKELMVRKLKSEKWM